MIKLFLPEDSVESPLPAITASVGVSFYQFWIWKTPLVPHSSPEMDSFRTPSGADSESKSFSLGRGETASEAPAGRPSS